MNRFPVQVHAARDPHLSRWFWLVKWLLLIPHYLILLFLWIAVVVTTLVAYVAVLFTGRYPAAVFAFNLGVLRWSWRVNYYGYQALGTDRYPPFTLADVPDYPARLQIDPPIRLPRWLPLLAWLFAIPHLFLVAALTGAADWQMRSGTSNSTTLPVGVVSVGLLIAGISLVFTGRYPRGLYDLLLGIARWSLRVTAYVTLLTGQYPPFRLDQGDDEPDNDPTSPTFSASVRPDEGVGGSGAAGAIRPPGSAAGPVTALVAGVLMLLLAAGVGVGGVALVALGHARDANGYVTSPTLQVSSPTAAITVEDVNLQAGDVWARNLSSIGGVRVTATSMTGTPLFLGVAPQSAVDGWLAGIAHDRLVAFTAGPSGRYARTSGSTQPVPVPAGQAFWLATANGAGPTVLNWQASNGDFAVTLANADGTPAVAATITVATQVPDPTPLAVGLLAAAVALLLLGFWLVYLGATRIGRRHHRPIPPTSPQTPAPELAGVV
jgi:hypothetical protein